MKNLSEWLNFASKLVWPIFIVGLMISFRAETRDVYNLLKNRIETGSSVKLGSFIELGQAANDTEVGALLLGDLPIEAIGGSQEIVQKSSEQMLKVLQDSLKNNPYRRVDTLVIENGKDYIPELLRDYVNTLGVRFIVFRSDGQFDGWIEAGVFLSQLFSGFQTLSQPEGRELKTMAYGEIKRKTVGISDYTVQTTETAKAVLQVMQQEHTENIPVLDGTEFKYFANRGEILSKLISDSILNEDG